MAIGTAMTGAVAKYVFPYEWCWPKALMFGAMMSATDPVAVVSLLKEVSKSLFDHSPVFLLPVGLFKV